MLRLSDYQAASGFLQRLYAHKDPETFPELVVRETYHLIGGDQATWNEMAMSVPAARVVAYPRQRDAPWVTRVFAAHMNEHPSIRAWWRERAARVRVLSDYVTAREYHRTAIYQRLYRVLGYEDQLAPALTPPDGHALALAFGRSARGVSKRDRDMAAFLSPHVLQAYRNVQALARAERTLKGHEWMAAALGQAVLELDSQGRILYGAERAQQWLRQYFSDAPRRCSDRLPASLAAWVCRRAAHTPIDVGQAPLVRRRGARRLVVRCIPAGGGGAWLALEERITHRGARALRSWGLTRREIEVLTELETGKTNAETGGELGISPATVKKHLDNIYAKLGVSNRTAAIARLREIGSD